MLQFLSLLPPVAREADLQELRPQSPSLSGFLSGPTSGRHKQEMGAQRGQAPALPVEFCSACSILYEHTLYLTCLNLPT